MSGQYDYPPMEWFQIPEAEVLKYIVAVVLGVVVCAWMLRQGQGKGNSIGCVVIAMIIVVGIFIFVFSKIPGEIVGIVLIAIAGGYIFRNS